MAAQSAGVNVNIPTPSSSSENWANRDDEVMNYTILPMWDKDEDKNDNTDQKTVEGHPQHYDNCKSIHGQGDQRQAVCHVKATSSVVKCGVTYHLHSGGSQWMQHRLP